LETPEETTDVSKTKKSGKRIAAYIFATLFGLRLLG